MTLLKSFRKRKHTFPQSTWNLSPPTHPPRRRTVRTHRRRRVPVCGACSTSVASASAARCTGLRPQRSGAPSASWRAMEAPPPRPMSHGRGGFSRRRWESGGPMQRWASAGPTGWEASQTIIRRCSEKCCFLGIRGGRFLMSHHGFWHPGFVRTTSRPFARSGFGLTPPCALRRSQWVLADLGDAQQSIRSVLPRRSKQPDWSLKAYRDLRPKTPPYEDHMRTKVRVWVR